MSMSCENNIYDSNSPVTLDDDVEMEARCCTGTRKSEEVRCVCVSYSLQRLLCDCRTKCFHCDPLYLVGSLVGHVPPKRRGMIASVAVSGLTVVLSLLVGGWFYPNSAAVFDFFEAIILHNILHTNILHSSSSILHNILHHTILHTILHRIGGFISH
mmetsp:Transcript_1876/g.4954  ORF Transcript_1876/g.4954 Transcript_1876/m.4954 type:complete len:157 (-) Transcript_1876:125-595(-)